jgi:hypothetical protein
VERDFLISGDYDPDVVGISVQPFAFRFVSRAGPTRSHTPDVFLRLRGGDAVVVDVRPENLIDERAAEAFAATEPLWDRVILATAALSMAATLVGPPAARADAVAHLVKVTVRPGYNFCAGAANRRLP